MKEGDKAAEDYATVVPPNRPAPGSAEELAAARAAADALRTILDRLAAGGPKPKKAGVVMASGRPRYWHFNTYEEAPGLHRVKAGSTRANAKPETTTYFHDLLPRWEYERGELREMLDDLENLAAGKGQPKTATRKAG